MTDNPDRAIARHSISRYPAGSAQTTLDYRRSHVPAPECSAPDCRMRVRPGRSRPPVTRIDLVYLIEFDNPLVEPDLSLWIAVYRAVPWTGRPFWDATHIAVEAAYAPVLRELGCELPGQQAMALDGAE